MRFDVRLRLFFLLILTILPIYTPILPCLLLVLGTELLLLCLMCIPMRSIFCRLRKLFLVFMGLAILQSVFVDGGQTVLSFGGVTLLTTAGISHSVIFFLRMVCIILAGCLLVGCRTQEIAQGLHQIGMPYDLCLLAMIGVKFVPILRQKFTDALLAIELRGISVHDLPFFPRLQVLTSLLMPTIVASIFMAKQVAISLQVRGFRAQSTRSSYRKLVFASADWVGLVSACGYVVLFVLGNEVFL